MPVKLRLMRMGKTKQPTYRVVASDSRSPRNGRFIELIGTYQPRLEPSGIKIDGEKALKWIRNGAQPTERVQKLLVAEGILVGEEAEKTDVAKKAARRPVKQTKAEKAAIAEAAAAAEKAEADKAAAAEKAEADKAAAEQAKADKAAADAAAATEAAAVGESPQGTPEAGAVTNEGSTEALAEEQAEVQAAADEAK